MDRLDDPFIAFPAASLADDFTTLQQRDMASAGPAVQRAEAPALALAPAVGLLLGFDLQEQANVGSLAACPGQVLAARSTVPLRREMVGRQVLLLFEGGQIQAPIIIGVLDAQPLKAEAAAPVTGVTVRVDGERHVIEAEREIVLRCGDASITLTRAGKVIIKGNYILSRSTGYNKIKGAAIDIN